MYAVGLGSIITCLVDMVKQFKYLVSIKTPNAILPALLLKPRSNPVIPSNTNNLWPRHTQICIPPPIFRENKRTGDANQSLRVNILVNHCMKPQEQGLESFLVEDHGDIYEETLRRHRNSEPHYPLLLFCQAIKIKYS